MNKFFIAAIIVIVSYLISCAAPLLDSAKQQECNMFIGPTKKEDCTGISVNEGFKCCAEYFRVVTMNTLACKYIENNEEKLDDELSLLKDVYNAKNVSIDCGANTYAISSLLVLFALFL